MDGTQPTAANPPIESLVAEAHNAKLLARDNTVLPFGELGDHELAAPSVTFASTIDDNCHARRAWGQGGATARAGGALDVAGVRRYAYAREPRRTGRVMSWLTNGFWAYCGSPASSIAG